MEKASRASEGRNEEKRLRAGRSRNPSCLFRHTVFILILSLVFHPCLYADGSLLAALSGEPAPQPSTQAVSDNQKIQAPVESAAEPLASFLQTATLSTASALDPKARIQAAAVSINQNAAFTGSRDVTLSVDVPEGAAGLQMRYAINSWKEEKFSAWETAAASKSIRLPSYDGINYVNVCFRDGQGNTGCKWDSIVLDQTRPAFSFRIDGGAAAVKSRDVALSFSGASDIVEIRYAFNSWDENKFSAWEAYTPEKRIVLPGYEGKNYVNVWVRDRAGNTACGWQTVLLDRTKPAGSVVINDGRSTTNSRDVTLSLSASDTGSSAVEFRYAFNTLKEEAFSAWEPLIAQKTVRLPDYKGVNYVNVCFRDRAGNAGCAWSSITYDPAYVPVDQRLLSAGMNYFDPRFGTVEPTHEYPGEGLDYMEYTQPSNLGFYAEILASVASGDMTQGPVSKEQALAKLSTLLDHLLADQKTLGYKGLLPWFKFDGTDWSRRDSDIFGRQVSFEDNTNLTLMLAAAYGALLSDSLSASASVHGEAGLLSKIDRFIENQKEGYSCLYDTGKGQFRRSMAINEAVTTCGEAGSPSPEFSGGYVDFFGAESRSPVLFLSLVYKDRIPPTAYTDLMLAQSVYTMADGTKLTTPAPFQGAFQMLWPALLMPEKMNPDLRAMQERYVDILLDYSRRQNIPGVMSASYNIKPAGNLLNASDSVVPFGDAHGEKTAEGWHITAANHTWSGTAFVQSNMDLGGNTLILKYKAATDIGQSYLEVKKEHNGSIDVIQTIPLALHNTGGAEETVTIPLSSISTPLSDVDELVLITNGGASGGPLDLTLTYFDAEKPVYRSFYDANAGIPEISFDANCCSSQAATLYALGIARMFRPGKVDAFLDDILKRYPGLVTEHGLWEGVNLDYNQVIREQIFANTATFLLGLAGKTPDHMLRYLQAKQLDDDLAALWNPKETVDVVARSVKTPFIYENQPGISYKLDHGIIVSGRTIEIRTVSAQKITQARLELKHRNASEPSLVLTFDVQPGTKTLEFGIPQDALYWDVAEFVLLFPQGAGTEGLIDSFRILS